MRVGHELASPNRSLRSYDLLDQVRRRGANHKLKELFDELNQQMIDLTKLVRVGLLATSSALGPFLPYRS